MKKEIANTNHGNVTSFFVKFYLLYSLINSIIVGMEFI